MRRILLSMIFIGSLVGAYYFYESYTAERAMTTPSSLDDLIWYQVPEIGIEFQIRKSAAEKLSYRYYYDMDNRIAGVYFSSIDLVSLPGCTFDGVMSMKRFSGTIDAMPFMEHENRVSYVKQFDNTVITFDGPPTACTRHEQFTTNWTNLFRNNQPHEGWMLSLFNSVKVLPFHEPEIPALTDESFEEQDKTTYQIPELGVEFQIARKIADELIYEVSTANDIEGVNGVVFSSKELAQIPGCEASSAPLGVLSKISGVPEDYEESQYYLARDTKQLDGFFVVWSGPQAVCSRESRDEFDVFLFRYPKFESYMREHTEFKNLSKSVIDTLRVIAEK